MASVKIADPEGRQFEVNLKRKLGEGGFGVVYLATEKSSKGKCAAKQQALQSSNAAALRQEVAMHQKVTPHEAIIGLLGAVEDMPSKHHWSFYELADGGELFDRLIDSGSLTEGEVKPYAARLFSALAHCHRIGVAHRDVKLENIMLCNDDPEALKLVDFGLAVWLPSSDMRFADDSGTKSYKAPEIFCKPPLGYLAPPLDMWAVGIVLFSLLSGFFPLDRADASDWRYASLAADAAKGIGACDSIYATYKRRPPFSSQAKAVLDGLLTIDPAKRLTAGAAAAHPWCVHVKGGEAMDVSGIEDAPRYRSLGIDGADLGGYSPPEGVPAVERQKAEGRPAA